MNYSDTPSIPSRLLPSNFLLLSQYTLTQVTSNNGWHSVMKSHNIPPYSQARRQHYGSSIVTLPLDAIHRDPRVRFAQRTAFHLVHLHVLALESARLRSLGDGRRRLAGMQRIYEHASVFVSSSAWSRRTLASFRPKSTIAIDTETRYLQHGDRGLAVRLSVFCSLRMTEQASPNTTSKNSSFNVRPRIILGPYSEGMCVRSSDASERVCGVRKFRAGQPANYSPSARIEETFSSSPTPHP